MRWRAGVPDRGPQYVDLPHLMASPRRPTRGLTRLFAKLTDGLVYGLEPDGTETAMGGVGGGGSLTGVSIKKETTGTTIGTSSTDIVGATLTIVPSVVETWVVYATWDFTWSVASAGNLGVGDLNFTGTGTMTAPSAALSGDQVVRATVASLGLITGVSAASHTIKLTALKTGAGGTLVTSGVSSLLVVRFAA